MINLSQDDYDKLKGKANKMLVAIYECDKHGVYEQNNCSVELNSCNFYLQDIISLLSLHDFSEDGYLQKRMEYLEVTAHSIPLLDKGDIVSLISRYTVAHDLVCFILIKLEMYVG